jgi:hypothetical protein
MKRPRLISLVPLVLCLQGMACDYATTVEGTVTVEGEVSYGLSGLDLVVWFVGLGRAPDNDGHYFLNEFTAKDDCGKRGAVLIGFNTQDPIQSKSIRYCEYNEVDFHIVPPAGPSG